MTNETALEIFDHLFSLLEAQETQSAAMLQLIKDKGIASDKELAPYLDQAGNASSVRWRAARVRINYLLSSTKPAEKGEEKKDSAQRDAAPVADKDRAEKESKGQQSEKPGHDEPEKAAAAKNDEPGGSNKAEQNKQTPGDDQAGRPDNPDHDKQAPRHDQSSRGDERDRERRSKSQAG
jgi:hypothetical protein